MIFYIVFEAILFPDLWSLFHNNGPIYDALFKPFLIFLRVALTFEKITFDLGFHY